jgi:hypothetical protein
VLKKTARIEPHPHHPLGSMPTRAARKGELLRTFGRFALRVNCRREMGLRGIVSFATGSLQIFARKIP